MLLKVCCKRKKYLKTSVVLQNELCKQLKTCKIIVSIIIELFVITTKLACVKMSSSIHIFRPPPLTGKHF